MDEQSFAGIDWSLFQTKKEEPAKPPTPPVPLKRVDKWIQSCYTCGVPSQTMPMAEEMYSTAKGTYQIKVCLSCTRHLSP
jgi:hypothetical protein